MLGSFVASLTFAISLFASFAVSSATSLLIASPTHATSYSASISTSGDVNMAVPGETSTIDHSDINIITNCKAGYDLTLSTSTTSNSLYLNRDINNNQSNKLFSASNGINSLRQSPGTWGFFFSSDTTLIPTIDSIFNPVPTFNTAPASIRTNSETISEEDINDNLKVYYGATGSATMLGGTYGLASEAGSGQTNTNSTGSLVYLLTISPSCVSELNISYDANANGDTVEDLPTEEDNEVDNVNNTVTLSDKTPRRLGYVFNSWNTEADGSGDSYDPGDTVETNHSITLYAIWDVRTSVSVGLNFGSSLTFGGSDYLNTNIPLFSGENRDMDFDITFGINSVTFVSGQKDKMNVLVADMNESGSPYPGFVFRYQNDNATNYNLAKNSQSGGGTKDYNKAETTSVHLQRRNKIFYSGTNAQAMSQQIDYASAPVFDTPLSFGASVDGSGKPFRFFGGELTDVLLTEIYNSSTISFTLPSPTYGERIFVGWYSDPEFTNKVGDAGDTVTVGWDTTFYAKWGSDEAEEYNRSGTVTCDGTSSSFINTKIYPYRSANINRNILIEFNVNSIGSDNANQATMMNNTLESSPYPGVVYRITPANSTTAQLRGGSSSTSSSPTFSNFTGNVRIVRIGGTWYYSMNGAASTKLVDVNTSTDVFDIPVTFCGSMEANKNPYRFFKGELSELSVNYLPDDMTIEDFDNPDLVKHDVTVNFTDEHVTSVEFANSRYTTVIATPATPTVQLVDDTNYTVTATIDLGYEVSSWSTTVGTITDATTNPTTYKTTADDTIGINTQEIPIYPVTVNFDSGVSSIMITNADYGTQTITPASATDNQDGTYTATVNMRKGIEYAISSSYVENYIIDHWATTENGTIGNVTAKATTYTVASSATLTLISKQKTGSATLLPGEELNTKIHSLKGIGSQYDEKYYKIKAIRMIESLPEGFTPSSSNIASVADSEYPVYFFFDNTNDAGVVYFFTDAKDIYLNEDSSVAFAANYSLTDISALSKWNTSRVTNMRAMFDATSLTNIDALENWDTSKVTNMSEMFNTTSLTNIDGARNWNTSSVINMYMMFYGAQLTNIVGASGWDTSSVTNASRMFAINSLTNLDALSNWNTSNMWSLDAMFEANYSLTDIDGVRNWDIKNVQVLHRTFASTGIENVDALENWDTSSVYDLRALFNNCTSLVNIDGLARWDTSKVWSLGDWHYNEGVFHKTAISNIDALANWDTSNFKDLDDMFSEAQNLTNIDGARNWNTSKVTSMHGVFDHATSLTDINALSNWDTSNVTDMYEMFAATSLTNVDALSNWSTSRVEDMRYMFSNTSSLTDTSGADNWRVNRVTATANDSSYSTNYFYKMFYHAGESSTSDYHPNFTTRSGVWNNEGTFIPTDTTVPSSSAVYVTVNFDEHVRSVGFYSETYGVQQVTTNGGMVRIAEDTEYMISSSYEDGYTVGSWSATGGTIENAFTPATIYTASGDTTGTRTLTLTSALYQSFITTVNMAPGVNSVVFTAPDGVTQVATSENNTVSLYNGTIYEISATDFTNGYIFYAWSSNDGGNLGSVFANPTTYVINGPSTLSITTDDTHVTINYDGNGLYYDNNPNYTTNQVTYVNTGSYPTTSYSTTSVTKYSHTPNVDDSGVVRGTYNNNLNKTDTVTIDGATSLNVTIYYDAESTAYDWVSVYQSPFDISNANDATTSTTTGNLSGKLSGSKTGSTTSYTTWNTKTYTITGDTVKFHFRSDNIRAYYGYYAVVTADVYTFISGPLEKDSGEYTTPSSSEVHNFLGWSEDKYASVPTYVDEADIMANSNFVHANSPVTLYAIHNPPAVVSVNYDENTSSIDFYNEEYGTQTVTPLNSVRNNNGTYTGTAYLYKNTEYTITATIVEEAIFSNWSTSSTGMLGDTDSVTTTYSVSSDATLDLVTDNNIAYLDIGQTVNTKMKNIAGYSFDNRDTNIRVYLVETIARATQLPTGFVPSDANTISSPSSHVPVYIFWDDFTLYYYSRAKVFMNKDSSTMFEGFHILENIDALENWDTSKVTNMSEMFDHFSRGDMLFSTLTNIDALANWDTSNVTNMSHMFSGTAITNLNALASWDTSSVTSISAMFWYTPLTNIDALANWDTSRVTYMSNMFSGTAITNLNALASWDTSNVRSMEETFYAMESLTDISGIRDWDTSSVTNMKGTFAYSISLTDASSINDWDVTAVIVTAGGSVPSTDNNFFQMFYLSGCSNGALCWPVHPTFTTRVGSWDYYGTFYPDAEMPNPQITNSTSSTPLSTSSDSISSHEQAIPNSALSTLSTEDQVSQTPSTQESPNTTYSDPQGRTEDTKDAAASDNTSQAIATSIAIGIATSALVGVGVYAYSKSSKDDDEEEEL